MIDSLSKCKKVAGERVADPSGMMLEQDGESQGKMVGIFRPFLTGKYQQVVMQKIRLDSAWRAIFADPFYADQDATLEHAYPVEPFLPAILGTLLSPVNVRNFQESAVYAYD